jgi:hypothetical protein
MSAQLFFQGFLLVPRDILINYRVHLVMCLWNNVSHVFKKYG